MMSGSADNTMRLWSVQTGKCLYRWEFPTAVKRVAFSEDDDQVVCVTEQRMGHQGAIRVFNINREGDGTNRTYALLMSTLRFSQSLVLSNWSFARPTRFMTSCLYQNQKSPPPSSIPLEARLWSARLRTSLRLFSPATSPARLRSSTPRPARRFSAMSAHTWTSSPISSFHPTGRTSSQAAEIRLRGLVFLPRTYESVKLTEGNSSCMIRRL